MNVEIKDISVADSIGKTGEMLEEHWQEVAKHKSLMVLKPDVQRYTAMEQMSMLIGLGAFLNGEMIGYSVTFIMPHMHYADLIVASNDVLFVRQQYRATRVGLKLISETERIAKERGARMMMWHAKPGTALDALMSRRDGYGVQDIIYSKEI